MNMMTIEKQMVKVKHYDGKIYDLRPEDQVEAEIEDFSNFEYSVHEMTTEMEKWLLSFARKDPTSEYAKPYLKKSTRRHHDHDSIRRP